MGNRIEPSRLRIAVQVERGAIGFDIQDWCTVDDVHIFNFQQVSLDTASRTTERPIAFGRLGARVTNIPWGLGSRKCFTSREWLLHHWRYSGNDRD